MYTCTYINIIDIHIHRDIDIEIKAILQYSALKTPDSGTNNFPWLPPKHWSHMKHQYSSGKWAGIHLFRNWVTSTKYICSTRLCCAWDERW